MDKGMTAPLCDIDSFHGPMSAEHIYTYDGEIDKRFGLYWFCPVPGCDGYGGKVKAASHEPKAIIQKTRQMEMEL